jgi:subtilisin family serine protease
MRYLLALTAILLTIPPVQGTVPSRTAALYYYNGGRQILVNQSKTRQALVVRSPERQPVVETALAATPLVSGYRPLGSRGLIELHTSASASEIVEAFGADADLAPVYFLGPDETEAGTMFVTGDVVVQFAPELDAEGVYRLCASLGLAVVEPLTYTLNGYLLRSDDARRTLAVANGLFESGLCLFSHPDFVAHRALRDAPNDPQYPDQWHLENKGQRGGAIDADVDVEGAWNITEGSADVIVAVADTGIDYLHEDLATLPSGANKIVAPRDVVHRDNDPSPQPNDADDGHGTCASGVAVATSRNGKGVAGVAPGCRLMPIQLYAESTFTPNSTEADAFAWAADNGAAVVSNSWGPDYPDTPLPDVTRAAMDYATTTGREGKGTVILFAAGNDAMDVARDNYANYNRVVAVAASTDYDTRSSYSNYGNAISVCAPSSGGSAGITTTDRTGNGGYSTTNYVSGFGGTSSACPLAAGAAALVISANPSLTWSQVKSRLEDSADKIDTQHGQYDGAGHSDLYGYGRVNAHAAVLLALQQSLDVEVTTAGGLIGAGGPHQIDWITTTDGVVQRHSISYSEDGAGFIHIAELPANATSYVWTPPDGLNGQVTVQVTATTTLGQVDSAEVVFEVWRRPAVSGVKVKQLDDGSYKLVIDGSQMRPGEVTILVGGVALDTVKYPAKRQLANGTTTRVVGKDEDLLTLLPANQTVTIVVEHARAGHASLPFSFTRT